MAKKNKIVLYKLQLFGTGFIAPPDIENGGTIWEFSTEPANVVFVGEMESSLLKDGLPESILEVVTVAKKKKHFEELAEFNLKAIKQKLFVKYADPHFIQASREKLLGNDVKWCAYIKRVDKIKAVKLGESKINFNDILND
jgi:hypothetical protein